MVHYGASWLGSEKVKMVKGTRERYLLKQASTSEPFEKRAYFQQNTYGLLINDPPFYFAFGCTKPKEEKKNKSLSLRQFPRLHAVREVSSCLYTMHASDSLSSQDFFNTNLVSTEFIILRLFFTQVEVIKSSVHVSSFST